MRPSIPPWLRDGHTAPQDVRKIAVQEFLPLAQYAASRQPRSTVQGNDFYDLRLPVVGGQACAVCWQCAPDASKHAKTNAKDLESIQLLEHFLDFLLACASKPRDSSSQNLAKPPDASSGLDVISNRFSTLSTGDTTERDELETMILTNIPSEGFPLVEYEAEDLEDD